MRHFVRQRASSRGAEAHEVAQRAPQRSPRLALHSGDVGVGIHGCLARTPRHRNGARRWANEAEPVHMIRAVRDLGSLPGRPEGIMSARAAREVGRDHELRGARADGQVVAIRRGVYVDAARYGGASADERQLMRIAAVATQRPNAVFAGTSAAILHGLPVVGLRSTEVVVLAAGSSGRRRNGVREIVRPAGEWEMLGSGFRATSIAATLIEVARSESLLTALTMVDAALHIPRFGAVGAICTRDELQEQFEAVLPIPGSRRVAAVLERATVHAETPLETLSRVRIEELGFPQPELQLRIERPRGGGFAYLDFGWPEYGVWGEADGDGKYLGSARRAGDRRDAALVVREEKRREDEVRAVTNWSCARWDWTEAWRAAPLRSILVEAGLPVVGRGRRR
ncbi:hypothetical protein ACWKWP_12715 [Agromyces soli]